jgi:hypothetical protein
MQSTIIRLQYSEISCMITKFKKKLKDHRFSGRRIISTISKLPCTSMIQTPLKYYYFYRLFLHPVQISVQVTNIFQCVYFRFFEIVAKINFYYNKNSIRAIYIIFLQIANATQTKHDPSIPQTPYQHQLRPNSDRIIQLKY